MKQALHKAFSITMAFLLLASTISWTVGKHYCMGRLMNVSLFEHAEDCGMAMNEMTETSFSDAKKSCCNDELVTVEGQDDLKTSLNDGIQDQHYFLVAFVKSYFNLFDTLGERSVPNEHYPPPLLIKDIHVLDSVFLI